MPMATLRLRPGVNAELTPSQVEAGYATMTRGRYRNGLAEKLGGWERFYANAVDGTPRALHAWLDLNETKRLAAGTTEALSVIADGVLADLTPQTRTAGLNSGNDRYTKVLLHFDGSDGSTTITDSARGASATHSWSVAADAEIDTDEEKFGGSALLLDGTGDWVTVSDHADFTLGDNDFTIDLWVQPAVDDTALRIAGQGPSGLAAASTAWYIDRENDNTIHAYVSDGSTLAELESTSTVETGAWTHIALERFGDTIYLKIDGEVEDSASFTGTVPDSSDDLRVGVAGEDTTTPWNGWVDEFRISVGIARWEDDDFDAPEAGYYAPTFSTTSGSPNVIIKDLTVSGTITEFCAVEFKTPVAVGGLILSGIYPVAVNLGASTFRIVASSNATSTVTDGGAVPVFSTTSGSATVSVALTAHGLDPTEGDKINFPISTEVGGLTVSGTYAATAAGSADEFSIAATGLASSTATQAMNDGEPYLVHHIAIGPVPAASGYSVGTYSSGTYSIGAVVAAQTGMAIEATDWSLDNWGEILIANPEGMGLYTWQPKTGLQNARLLAGSGAPTSCTAAFVSMQTQMLIVLGGTDGLAIGVDRDPLLVKWSDNGDFTSFTPSTSSQAGSRRLSTGSEIVGGMSASSQELIWTDLGLWSMSYLGSLAAGVWGFNQIGYNCGLIGKHAACRLGSNVYWMGQSNFFVLTGQGVSVIPCKVWDVVFQDLNRNIDSDTGRPHAAKAFAWANTPFNEVWFFFPRESTGATECDYYVKFNVSEGVWDHAGDRSLPRSAGIDQSIVGLPIAAHPGGVIYEHETSRDEDGQPMTWHFETGWFPLSEGQDIIFLDWVLPDMRWGVHGGAENASISVTLSSVYYPGETPTTYGPYTVTKSTPYITPRVRGRLARIKVGGSDLGTFARLGAFRMRVQPDGRHP